MYAFVTFLIQRCSVIIDILCMPVGDKCYIFTVADLSMIVHVRVIISF